MVKCSLSKLKCFLETSPKKKVFEHLFSFLMSKNLMNVKTALLQFMEYINVLYVYRNYVTRCLMKHPLCFIIKLLRN